MTSHVDEKTPPRMIGRRAVARGAAWSVPVVALAVAAPAVAASTNCTMGTLSWDTFRNGVTGLGTFATTIPGLTVTIAVSGDTAAADNARVTNVATGGLSQVLRFYDQEKKNGTSQTVSITFSKAVRNVQFSLLDVDSALATDRRGNITDNYYQDQVQIVTPTSWSGTTHSNIVGTGTAASPYKAKNTNSPIDGSDAASNVDLVFPGGTAGLTQVQFKYSQGAAVDGGPFIGMSDLLFQYCA
ncbi:MAG TPA: hypothetical protein VHW64_07160 [Nocardioides sp.]|jgi:hypothetical protein|uniref:hypothetical protein n=1 Tax=Nocardioides sp. TaxID=35761 RepID=UPI002E3481F0|nr:hypothetical protein [Nocardioides sp.]HEX3930466.1 hypothetical protein [Nocardioides sp.]